MEDRLSLPQVTLCAVTSVNVAATVQALEKCIEQVNFAACKLLTDADVQEVHPGIAIIKIEKLSSSNAYSEFMLTQLINYIDTSHCLVAQWDGHILDAGRWRTEFLDYDYIGASWPQFDDDYNVGNGGFSLRSQRLIEACQSTEFIQGGAEDIAICRNNRRWLEAQGMIFADRELADVFSTERAGDLSQSFGYHGVFNMPQAIGVEAFWEIYQTLDDRGTLRHDFWPILRMIGRGVAGRGLRKVSRMIFDYIQ